MFLAPSHLRIRFRCVLEYGHRIARIPCVGPSHVRKRPIRLCEPGLLVSQLPRGDPFGDQGL